MRRIFLDLGSHIGESIEYFRLHHPEADQFEYFCFEPLPENIKELSKLQKVTIIPMAAYIEDSRTKLYTGLSESGSMSSLKRTGNLDGKTHIVVDTMDFPNWLHELTNGDYVPEIWLKMNIEGAEYPIIEKMRMFGLIPFVHRFFIQWHYQKIGMDVEDHDKIKAMIPEEKLFPWLAMLGGVEWFKKSL